jgi:hypothetical protein
MHWCLSRSLPYMRGSFRSYGIGISSSSSGAGGDGDSDDDGSGGIIIGSPMIPPVLFFSGIIGSVSFF